MNENYYLQSDIKEIFNNLKHLKKNLSGKKFLISGANGFLGKYFIRSLIEINKTLSKKIKILAIDIKFDQCEIYNDKNVKKLKQDINSIKNITFKSNYVLHAAGIPSPKHYYNKPIEAIFTSITGTKKLLEYSKKNNSKFIFFSSSEIYGNPDSKNIPTSETYNGNVSCIEDRSCYDEGKRVGETLCYFYKIKQKVNVAIFRPFNVFGPGMQETDYRVLPNFTSRIKGNIPLQIYGTGNQTRTFCYITDAMEGFIRVILNGVPGESYNIGNPNPEISVISLIKKIESILGKKVMYDIVDYPDSYPADEPSRRCPDILKAKLQIKYEPRVDIDEGLKRFINWSDKVYKGKQ